MNQIPQNFQNQNYRYPAPQVNAVKIDIINPEAYGGASTMGQPQTPPPAPNFYNYPQAPMYNMPQQQTYNMPQAPVYAPPVANQAPMYNMPQQQTYNMPQAPVYASPVANQAPVYLPPVQPKAPVYTPPVAPAPVPVAQAPVTTPITTPIPVPVAQTPVVVPVVAEPQVQQTATQVVNTAPVVPPPAIVEQPAPAQVAAPAPAVTTPATQVAPETKPAETVAVQTEPVVAPTAAPATPAPEFNLAELNTSLKSTDLDAQTKAIQKIAELGQNNPEVAAPLLNEETFKALADIITKDTSTLAGPKEGQTDISPLEKAEMNKQFGTYTLAVLQKNFRDAVNVEAKKQGLPPITINELPGIIQEVDNLKSNPNPVVREATIQALNYVAQPEDKPVLKTLFDIAAKQDADPTVKESAQKALASLQA